jgi:hypothetical protein
VTWLAIWRIRICSHAPSHPSNPVPGTMRRWCHAGRLIGNWSRRTAWTRVLGWLELWERSAPYQAIIHVPADVQLISRSFITNSLGSRGRRTSRDQKIPVCRAHALLNATRSRYTFYF